MSLRFSRLLLAGLLSASAAIAFSCGKGGSTPAGPKTIDDSVTDTVWIRRYDVDDASETYPRFSFEYGDFSGVEIAYPGFSEEKALVLQIANHKDYRPYLVSVSEEGLSMVAYNPESDQIGADALSAKVVGDKIRFGHVYIDSWSGSSYISEYTEVELTPAAKSAMARIKATKGATEDMIRKSFYDMFEEISANISKASNFLGGSAGDLCTMWTKVVIPIAELNLYSDDLDTWRNLKKGEYKEKAKDVVMSYFAPPDGLTGALWTYAKVIKNVRAITDGTVPYVNDIAACIRRSVAQNDRMKAIARQVGDFEPEWQVNLYLTAREDFSASVRAEAKALADQASPLYFGEFYWGEGNNANRYGTSFNEFPAEWTVSNLSPGKDYSIMVIGHAENGYNYPAVVHISTPNVFSAEPSSVMIPIEGGETAVHITLPTDSWTWSVKEKPSWVTVTGIGRQTLFFKVQTSTEVRSGSIVLEATNGSDVQECIVMVSQEGSGWDGTAWTVDPKLNINKTGKDAESIQYGNGFNHIEFVIYNAATGSFRSNCPWDSMRISGKTLVFTYNSTKSETAPDGSIATIVERGSMSVTWIDSQRASVSVSASSSVSGALQGSLTLSGSGTATRTN